MPKNVIAHVGDRLAVMRNKIDLTNMGQIAGVNMQRRGHGIRNLLHSAIHHKRLKGFIIKWHILLYKVTIKPEL